MASNKLVPIERVPIILHPDSPNQVATKILAPKISPKLIEFSQWSKIDEVNKRLDNGESPKAIHRWITENGFNISHPWVYEYAKLRKKALVEGVSMEHILGVMGKGTSVIDVADLTKSTKEKLRSEIDALDLLIQGGYKTLLEWGNRPVTPKLMMDAIRLKNDLTDGHHGFLTNFGMEHLRDIENAKYSLVIDHLISYIPDDKKVEAISKISEIEDNYYQNTDYYEEYLRASGEFTEAEIEKKLQVWKTNRKKQ